METSAVPIKGWGPGYPVKATEYLEGAAITRFCSFSAFFVRYRWNTTIQGEKGKVVFVVKIREKRGN